MNALTRKNLPAKCDKRHFLFTDTPNTSRSEYYKKGGGGGRGGGERGGGCLEVEEKKGRIKMVLIT